MVLLQENKRCEANEFVLGNTVVAEACNDLCADYQDCSYFSFNRLTRECKISKTDSPFCPAGFS
jgi:hypothetical protein